MMKYSKEFMNWLKEDSLLEYYFNNPDQQNMIEYEFNKEVELHKYSADPDAVVHWILFNPSKSDEVFPILRKKLVAKFDSISPFRIAVMIQRLIKEFPKWRFEYKATSFEMKKYLSTNYIEILTSMLSSFDSSELVIKETIFDFNSIIESELSYWLLTKNKLEKDDSEITINLDTNPHPRIFINKSAFEFFERLRISEITHSQGSGYAFIFHKMRKDELVFPVVKEKEFRSWLNSNYEICLNKFKPLEYIGQRQLRTSIYTSLKN